MEEGDSKGIIIGAGLLPQWPWGACYRCHLQPSGLCIRKILISWSKIWEARSHYGAVDGLTCEKWYIRAKKRVGKELMRGYLRSAARKNKGDFKTDAENTNVNINVKNNVQSTGKWSSCCRILQIGLEKTPEAVTKEQIICLTVSRTEWSNKAFPFLVSGTGKLMLDAVPNYVF